MVMSLDDERLEAIIKKYFFGVVCKDDSLSISVGMREEKSNGKLIDEAPHSIYEAIQCKEPVDIKKLKGSEK
jgi:hypothetical protein